jgi:hypothetical protein
MSLLRVNQEGSKWDWITINAVDQSRITAIGFGQQHRISSQRRPVTASTIIGVGEVFLRPQMATQRPVQANITKPPTRNMNERPLASAMTPHASIETFIPTPKSLYRATTTAVMIFGLVHHPPS